MGNPVVIVDYDLRWPDIFAKERKRILDLIGPRVAAIEHMGSTAVPGLGAKPIVDILIGFRKLADAEKCIEPLQSLDYTYFPQFEDELPERRYLDRSGYHLHMVEIGGEFWERHLLFRDYLRAHPEVARQYHELKKDLAAQYGSDREGYTNAKTSFVRSVEAAARDEKAPNHHTT